MTMLARTLSEDRPPIHDMTFEELGKYTLQLEAELEERKRFDCCHCGSIPGHCSCGARL